MDPGGLIQKDKQNAMMTTVWTDIEPIYTKIDVILTTTIA